MHQVPAPVSIQVALRCRPFNSTENAKIKTEIIQCSEDNNQVTLYCKHSSKTRSSTGSTSSPSQLNHPSSLTTKTYTFDAVFGPNSSQQDVYQRVCYPLVQEVLQGYHCTVFAYGQTGTGKTFTMEGQRDSLDQIIQDRDPENAGIIPRAVKQIFSQLASISGEYEVKVSHLEIYNEGLTDLLSSNYERDGCLRLYDEPLRGVFVAGLEEVSVETEKEIFSILDTSAQKRRTEETLMNSMSSRSHSVFTITIHMKQSTQEGEEILKIGKLNLVDLAGSENIGRSGATDQRAREAGNINQSLLTLGRVINALVEKKTYVPYRDSKLTRILQESLGGRNKTCILATVGPAQANIEETMSTLEYASRAKSIKNRPVINQVTTKRDVFDQGNHQYMENLTERRLKELAEERLKDHIIVPKSVYHELISVKDGQTEDVLVLHEILMRLKEDMEETQMRLAEEECMLKSAEDDLTRASSQLHKTEIELTHTLIDLDSKRKKIEEQNHLICDLRQNEVDLCGKIHDLETLLASTENELESTRICFQNNNADLDRTRAELEEKKNEIEEKARLIHAYEKNEKFLRDQAQEFQNDLWSAQIELKNSETELEKVLLDLDEAHVELTERDKEFEEMTDLINLYEDLLRKQAQEGRMNMNFDVGIGSELEQGKVRQSEFEHVRKGHRSQSYVPLIEKLRRLADDITPRNSVTSIPYSSDGTFSFTETNDSGTQDMPLIEKLRLIMDEGDNSENQNRCYSMTIPSMNNMNENFEEKILTPMTGTARSSQSSRNTINWDEHPKEDKIEMHSTRVDSFTSTIASSSNRTSEIFESPKHKIQSPSRMDSKMVEIAVAMSLIRNAIRNRMEAQAHVHDNAQLVTDPSCFVVPRTLENNSSKLPKVLPMYAPSKLSRKMSSRPVPPIKKSIPLTRNIPWVFDYKVVI